MPYNWDPTHFDGVDLKAAPFLRCSFDARNGPGQLETFEVIESAIVDVGSRFVRGQPQPGDWEVHCYMSAMEDAQLAAMRKVWSPDRGLAFLRANDGQGSPVSWRVPAFCRGFDRIEANHWLARVYVPNPVWEENAASPFSQAVSVSPTDIVVVNNGDRLVRPTITFTGTNAAADPAMDFTIQHRQWVANRSSYPLNNTPVLMLTVNTAALRVVAGVTRQINQGGGIGASDPTIPYDTSAGSWPASGGFGWIDSEQFYYAAYSGTQFTGCVRGIGGTGGVTHADNAVITRSDILANGDDIRAFVEGEEVPCFLGAFNTTATKIWCVLSTAGRRKFHNAEAWSTSAPADAGEFLVDPTTFAGDDGLADAFADGMFVIRGGSDELVSYRDVDVPRGAFLDINRGSWYTTPTSHAKGEVMYFVERVPIVIAMGRRGNDGTNAWPAGSVTPPPPYRPIEQRPAIDCVASDNTQWRWGNTASDPDTVLYDPDRPDRPASFIRVSEVPPTDQNAALGLRLETSVGRAGWIDSAADLGKPIIPRLSLYVPQGIEAVASGITYDVQQRRNIRLRILGRDATGFEIELADRQDVDEALATAQTITPAAVLHELILQGVRAAVTGMHVDTSSPSTTRIGSTAGSEFVGTKFVLEQDTMFKSVQLAMQKGGAGDGFSYEVYIVEDPGGADPFAGKAVAQMRHSSAGTGPAFPATSLTTSYVVEEYRNDLSPTFFLKAGTYWIVVKTNTLAGGDVGLDVFQKSGSGRAVKKTQAGTLTDEDPFFYRIIHAHGGPVQADAELLQTGAEGFLDTLIVQLNDVATDPWTPLVGTLQAATSHLNGRLENITNGTGFDLDWWKQLTSQGDAPIVTVDAARRRVTYAQSNWIMEIGGAITPLDDAEVLALEPGSNTLRWTEPAPSLTIAGTYRGNKG